MARIMAIQKFIKVGSSIAAVIPKQLLGLRSAGTPIRIARGTRPNTFVVQVLPRKKTAPLSSRERRILATTDAFIDRYRADLKRLKDA